MHVSGHDLFQALVKVSFTPAHTRSKADTQGLPTPPEPQPRSAEVAAPEPESPAAALRYQRSEKTSLRLLTQEGDVVRIRIQDRTSARASLGDAGDGFDEMRLDAETSAKLRVNVQGHLNESELTAIQHAIGQAAEIADYFFSNDVDKAFAAAESFQLDTEQLSGLKLRLRMRESALYAPTKPQAPPAPAIPEAPPDGATVPTPSPTDANEAAVAAATVASLAPVAEPEGAAEGTAAEEPAADGPLAGTPLADAPAASRDAAGMAEALRAIGDFLAHVVDTVGRAAADGPTDQLSASLKVRIVRSTVEALDQFREDSRTKVPLLAGDMLEALAAEFDPPLEELG